MKILILHQYFRTPEAGGALRSYYLAKGLVNNGHTPVIITCHNERKYLHITQEGIEIHYLPISYDNSFDYFQRGNAFMKYVFRSIRIAMAIPDVDRVYAISVPLTIALVARWLSFRKNIPYIFEVGDLWPDAPVQMGFVKNPVMKSILYSMERAAYENAESVVALSPSIQEAIKTKAPGKTVSMVPNMSDCEFYSSASKDPTLQKQFGVEGKFVVSYTGAIGLANGLDYLLECANLCRKGNLPVHFFVCGTGRLLERLKGSAKQLGLENITFTGYINRDGVRGILNVSDAAFVCYKNLQILETGSPNKFFDGLAAGKLIIINFGGWIAREIEENKCGVRLSATDPTDFVRKIQMFINDGALLRAISTSCERTCGEEV